MNTKNNKRRQASREKIALAFIELLQSKALPQITVSELCKRTGLNRSTFYANFEDIYDLADQVRRRLEAEVSTLYEKDEPILDYLRLFYHIRENQVLYNIYFSLGYDASYRIPTSRLSHGGRFFPEEHLAYHAEFHRAGLNAVIKQWLKDGCRESPETMVEIIRSEYRGRNLME